MSEQEPPRPARSRCYPVQARPAIAVRHRDGRWYPGRLHAWIRTPEGRRVAVVSYVVDTGIQYYGPVATTRVRPRGRATAGAPPRPDSS